MADIVLFGAGGRPNPERFKEARRAVGLSQVELAERLAVTRQAVSSYEQGERQPDPLTVVKIAQILGQPLSFFTGNRPNAAGPIGPAFYRSRKSTTKLINDRCEIWRAWYAQSAHILAAFVQFPAVAIPSIAPSTGRFYSEGEIEDAANTCRRFWGLGDGPIANVVAMLESKGIIIARAALGTDTVDAFSFWCGPCPMIVLGNEKDNCVRSRFDAAHELGHLILHRGVGEEELESPEVLARIESEAHRFAGAFLLPSVSYSQEVFTTKIGGFVQLKERWKVSVAAQIYRCLDVGIISEDQALNLRKQISRLKWRKREPLDDVLKPEEPILLRKAFDLVVSSRVASPSEVATRARLDVSFLAAFYNVDVARFAAPSNSGPVLKLNNAWR